MGRGEEEGGFFDCTCRVLVYLGTFILSKKRKVHSTSLLNFSLTFVFTFVLLFSHFYSASLYFCIFLHLCSLVFLQHSMCKFFVFSIFLFSGPSHGGGTPFRYTQQNSVFRFLEDLIRRQQQQQHHHIHSSRYTQQNSVFRFLEDIFGFSSSSIFLQGKFVIDLGKYLLAEVTASRKTNTAADLDDDGLSSSALQ